MKRAKWFAYSFYFAVAIIAFWYWHVDEHYQIFEFASYKLGFTPSENLAWEFHSKIRSGIMPIAAFGVAKIFISIKLFNPFIVEAIFRLLSAALFLFSYFRLLNFFDIKDDSRFYLICIFFWILPIIMVRYSSESIAGSLFWLGFTQFDFRKSKKPVSQNLIIGLLWGLSFYVRIQMGILIGICFVWTFFFQRKKTLDFFFILVGFLFASLIELSASYWLYDQIVWSPYNYFIENIVFGKASSFGVEPWYYYFSEISKNLIYPLGILVWVGCISYSWQNKQSIFVWMFWSFLVLHSIIGHKEYRFMFPIFAIFIPMGMLGLKQLLEHNSQSKRCLKFIWYFNLILLPSAFMIHSFKPLNHLAIYPYTVNNRTLLYMGTDPFALGERFPQVKSYFWKFPTCRIIPIENQDSIEGKPKIVLTSTSKGDSFVFNKIVYLRQYQTITPKIEKLLPASILGTIDYLYIYQPKKIIE